MLLKKEASHFSHPSLFKNKCFLNIVKKRRYVFSHTLPATPFNVTALMKGVKKLV